MKKKEVIFVGFDIYKFVKNLSNQFSVEETNMTNGEKEAYKLGVDNVLGILKQTLNEVPVDDTGCSRQILVHVPDLSVITEFATLEDIIDNYKQ